ncbi:hypothetical protein [Gordonia insulae]|uniref:Uncharacterized protein n=1 Tax=Gordonia insulae TaxID=2420509 RepID=A0A3G8JJN3_9ACTN|nr:hypothetical protein [Gordonia insulae]AZG44709.1 hypothetical protein D7316_01295 [Gordonia insulae]
MTTFDPGAPELDITTAHGIVTRLPTSFPIIDPELDGHLDPDLFQKGFDDANSRLDTFPRSWARHHASTTMAAAPAADDDEPSYTRGYRAALYGYLRHSAD